MAKLLTLTPTMSLSVQTGGDWATYLHNIAKHCFFLIYYPRYPLQDPRVPGGHWFDTKWAFLLFPLKPAFCSSHLPTCPILAMSVASEKSSYTHIWVGETGPFSSCRGWGKGRSRRKGTHLKRTYAIFCPSQHLQWACKDTIFTTRVSSAAACMDTHRSLASLEATLSENLYPNTSRDPSGSCSQLFCRNPPLRALTANSLNRYSVTPLDAKGPSASSHSKSGIARYHHYYSPTWHLWLFTESRLQIILCPQNIPWNDNFHHQKLSVQSWRIKRRISLYNKTKCSCHSYYCSSLCRFSLRQRNSTIILQK